MEVDVSLVERVAQACNAISKKLDAVQTNLQVGQPAAQRLSSHLEHTSRALNGLKEQLETLNPIWSAIKGEQADRIAELAKAVEDTSAELSQKVAKLNAKEHSHDSLQTAYSELNTKFSAQILDFENLKAQHGNSQSARNKLEQELEASRQPLEKAIRDLKAREATVSDQQNKLKEWEHRVAALQPKLSATEGKKKILEETVAKHVAEITRMQGRLQHLSSAQSDLQNLRQGAARSSAEDEQKRNEVITQHKLSALSASSNWPAIVEGLSRKQYGEITRLLNDQEKRLTRADNEKRMIKDKAHVDDAMLKKELRELHASNTKAHEQHSNAISALQEQRQAAIDKSKLEHDGAIKKLHEHLYAQKSSELEKLRDEHRRAGDELQKKHQAELEKHCQQLRDDQTVELERVQQVNAETANAMQQRHQQALDEVIKRLGAEKKAKIEQIQHKNGDDSDLVRNVHLQDMKRLEAEQARQVAELQQQQVASVEAARRKHQQDQLDMEQRLRAEKQAALDQSEQKHAHNLHEIQETLTKQVEEIKQRLQEQEARTAKAEESRRQARILVDEIKDKHSREKTELLRRLESEKKAEVDEKQQECATEIEGLLNQVTKLQAQVQAASAQVGTLQARDAEHAQNCERQRLQAAAAHDRLRQSHRSQIEQVRVELTRQTQSRMVSARSYLRRQSDDAERELKDQHTNDLETQKLDLEQVHEWDKHEALECQYRQLLAEHTLQMEDLDQIHLHACEQREAEHEQDKELLYQELEKTTRHALQRVQGSHREQIKAVEASFVRTLKGLRIDSNHAVQLENSLSDRTGELRRTKEQLHAALSELEDVKAKLAKRDGASNTGLVDPGAEPKTSYAEATVQEAEKVIATMPQLWAPPAAAPVTFRRGTKRGLSSELWTPPAKSRRITDRVHTLGWSAATTIIPDTVHAGTEPREQHQGRRSFVESRVFHLEPQPSPNTGSSHRQSPGQIYDIDNIQHGDQDEDEQNVQNGVIITSAYGFPVLQGAQTVVPQVQHVGAVLVPPIGFTEDPAAANAIAPTVPQGLGSVPLDTRPRDLRDLFHLDWVPTSEEDRRIDAMIARQFVKTSSVDDKMKRIDQHVVGILTGPPPYPRPCLWAQLLGGKVGTGDKQMQNCAFCKQKRYRDDAICVWAEYAPGVQDGFPLRRPDGRVMSRTEPMKVASEKDWRKPQANLTVPINGKSVRWVLKRRPGRLPGT